MERRAMHRREFLLAAGAVAAGATPLWARDDADSVRGELTQLTAAGNGDNRATYMPDGKSLLFISSRSGRSQIWRMGADGGGALLVQQSSANDFGRVAPSPDGKQLCFSSDRDGENAIHVMDLETAAVTRISDLAYWSFGPTWSSRGLIAYFSRKGGNRINIWTVRPDGTDARQITDRPGESRQPWWSPDGRRLAYSADNGTGSFQLWLAAEDGSQSRAITRQGGWQQPFFSPDGREIAVSARLDGGVFRIVVINADGSGIRKIAQPEATDNVHPAWSPDGRSIVFTSGMKDAGALLRFTFA
jgi:Tol biopolymer transport system component